MCRYDTDVTVILPVNTNKHSVSKSADLQENLNKFNEKFLRQKLTQNCALTEMLFGNLHIMLCSISKKRLLLLLLNSQIVHLLLLFLLNVIIYYKTC